jgi:hypothetical protein
MTAYIPMIIDGIVAALLIATIVYAVILNRQIKGLRDSRSELADFIKGLNDATANAEAAVRGLRKAAGETGEQLQRAVDKGAVLRDELQFMIDSGNALADRLGGATAGMGERARPELRMDHSRNELRIDHGRNELRADHNRNELRADHGRGDPRGEPATRLQPAQSQQPSRGGGMSRPLIDEGLMAAARAEASRHNPGGAEAPPGRRDGGGSGGGSGSGSGGEGDGLSRAERELLQALESRR